MDIASIIRWFRLNIEFDVKRSRKGFYFFKVNDTYVCISSMGVDCKVWESMMLSASTPRVQICFSNRELQNQTTLKNQFSDLFKVNQYSYIKAQLNEESLSQIKESIFEIENGKYKDPLGISIYEDIQALPPPRYTVVRIDDNGHNTVGKVWNSIERAKEDGKLYLQTHTRGKYKLEVMAIAYGQVDGKLYPKTFPIANGEITENKIYKNMKKNVKRINESQLRAIVAESVKRVLNEDMFNDGGYSEETLKNISWAKKEAIEKLQYMMKEFEKLPEKVSAYRANNIAMTRLAIQQLQRVHSIPYKEELSSLSMQQRQGLRNEF